MSDRSINNGRPLKPTIASNRLARTPLTPRLAANATPSIKSAVSKTPSTTRSEPPKVTPKVKQEETSSIPALVAGNVTPRSSARKSRLFDSNSTTPTQDDETPSAPRPRSTVPSTTAGAERSGSVAGLGVGIKGARASRPKSLVSDSGSSRGRSPPLIRSPGRIDLGRRSRDESIDSRFFHASDVQKQEPAAKRVEVKKVEIKKAATFMYADGQQEERQSLSPMATSPVLSAVSEQRSSGPWIRADSAMNPSKSPPMLSPALSSISNASPFFAAATGQQKPRSPSPSKENIHLSYRKGASQIFGTRPSPRTTDTSVTIIDGEEKRRGSLTSTFTPHRKSPSLSSIHSSNSQQSRRRSATTLEPVPAPSPLAQEVKSATVPPMTRPPHSIDTSLDPPERPQSALSPTKSISDLAADARRERKVLDLEISNSSLLAINSSLEREVRRQKAELKRFRRLSRAGRFSVNPHERSARLSEGLSTLGEEEGEDQDYSAFGPPSGFTDVYDDFSEEEGENSDEDDDDDESESATSVGDSISPSARRSRDSDRLAKDEKRLRHDLEKHKELLVQSQMMNQSLKRCTYAAEEMIREGKKALEYHVRVSDVRLGGRILTGHEEDDEDRQPEDVIEVEDETVHGAAEQDDDIAKDFLEVWQGVGRVVGEGSEGGDRDSGIEVDKPARSMVGGGGQSSIDGADSGRPPDKRSEIA